MIIVLYCSLKMSDWDFPGGPVAKTPCSKSGDSIPGQRTERHVPQLKIPTAIKNSHTATKDSVCAEKSEDCSKKEGKEEGRKEKEGTGKERGERSINLDMWN